MADEYDNMSEESRRQLGKFSDAHIAQLNEIGKNWDKYIEIYRGAGLTKRQAEATIYHNCGFKNEEMTRIGMLGNKSTIRQKRSEASKEARFIIKNPSTLPRKRFELI